jgi:signal peptidase I
LSVLLTVAVACALVLSIVAFLRHRYLVVTIMGVSMEPAYGPGDRVLVRRTWLGSVRRGHVVVFTGGLAKMWPDEAVRGPDGAAQPGGVDPSAGTLPDATEVPDPKLPEAFRMIKRVIAVPGDPVPRDEVPALRHVPERVVPDGCLVVLGDNAEDSRDSRHFGYLPFEKLVGVVVRCMASVGDAGTAR